MTIFIVVSAIIIIFIACFVTTTQSKESPANHNEDELTEKTTGNDTYDFINDATGVELFEYEKNRDD